MFNWFQTLNKPFLTPPAFIFPIAWTILYTLIAISIIFYIKDGITKEKVLPIILYVVQLLFNFAWSPVFFGLHNMKMAFCIVLIMIILTVIVINMFYKTSKIAAYLLIPYLSWIIFAAYLNFNFILLN